MREKIAIGLAWTKIVTLSMVGLYVLILLFLNRNATIQPSLRLMFVEYKAPNAILTIFLASTVSVAACYLGLSLYRSVRTLRELQTKRRLVSAERTLAEIQAAPRGQMSATHASPGSLREAVRKGDDGPIPLE